MILTELLLQAETVTPWFDQQTGTYIGAFGGAGAGVLGGLVGMAGGLLVPHGKGRGFVLGTMATCAILGAISVLTGLVGLILGQPYHVYYPLLLLGGVLGGVMGGLLPVVRRRYMEAEQRRLDADALRRS